MMNNLKIAGVAALAAAGLASAAVAQPTSTSAPQQHQQMTPGGMQNGQMMPMMSDPQMRKEMMEMMESCNRMMQNMGDMPGANAKPNG